MPSPCWMRSARMCTVSSRPGERNEPPDDNPSPRWWDEVCAVTRPGIAPQLWDVRTVLSTGRREAASTVVRSRDLRRIVLRSSSPTGAWRYGAP